MRPFPAVCLALALATSFACSDAELEEPQTNAPAAPAAPAGPAASVAPAAPGPAVRQGASEQTKSANAAVLGQLPFANREDFELASRGLIAKLPSTVIRAADGRVVWDMDQYGFLDGDAPATVNPSLWRQAQLNTTHGLFQVTDRIYQVRGYDLSNMSLIQGDSGWIVIDPLISAETAKAALDLVQQNLGERPVVAVIYTHSHADHFGGVRGVVSKEEVEAGKVRIVAPVGFLEDAVSENVLAGNVMTRRASYMYGNLLPKAPDAQVDGGLGKTTSSGSVTLLAPTDIISETGQKMTIDGVEIVFQNTPGAEAPAEMMFYFPQMKALLVAEEASANLHNLYTLRGAQVRDASAWAGYLHQAIQLFGDDLELVFGSHHWPRWGREAAIDYLKKQRDLYKYIHDQTLRLANHGLTMLEIAEQIQLPQSLATEWFDRDYYGTVNHNVKAVYQKYLGWFDGNPAHLHPLPPVEASQRYVRFMGGADAVLAKARESYAQGDYRWVAEVVNHVVFAEPENEAARRLQADALEQLGYQAESAPWRNFYLSAAQELRDGVKKEAAPRTASPDMVSAMTLDMFFDFLAVRLNGPAAEGKKLTLNFVLPDTGQKYVLFLENAALNHTASQQAADADATITLTRATLDQVALGQAKLEDKATAGEVTIEGNPKALGELMALLDTFPFWFDIVTP